MTELLHLLAVCAYAGAAVLLGLSFARGWPRLSAAPSLVLGVGLVLHAAGIAAFTASRGELPLVGLGPSLSTLAFLFALGSVVASTLGHAQTLGLIMVPLVALLLGLAVAVGIEPIGEPGPWGSLWFVLHVLLAFVGYAGLAVAFAAGLMYLLQFRELKSKHFGAIFRFFPPLHTLDRLGRGGLLVGFAALSLALVVGWAWTTRFLGALTPDGDKLAWAGFTWLVFVAALLARAGTRGVARRGAMASVLGFVAVVVAYLLLRVQSAPAGVFL